MSSVYFLKGKFMNVEKKYYLSYRRYVSRFESYLWGGWFCLVSLAILICGAFFVFNEIIFFSCDIYSIAYAVIVLCASIVSSYASIIVLSMISKLYCPFCPFRYSFSFQNTIFFKQMLIISTDIIHNTGRYNIGKKTIKICHQNTVSK